MTDFCAHPGCVRALHAGNTSGVCRAHLHGPACRCARCEAIQRPVPFSADRPDSLFADLPLSLKLRG